MMFLNTQKFLSTAKDFREEKNFSSLWEAAAVLGGVGGLSLNSSNTGTLKALVKIAW